MKSLQKYEQGISDFSSLKNENEISALTRRNKEYIRLPHKHSSGIGRNRDNVNLYRPTTQPLLRTARGSIKAPTVTA